MTSVNIQESQTLLSRYVKRVIAGETIIPCDRNRPIAENRPIVESSSTFRLRLYKDRFEFLRMSTILCQSLNGSSIPANVGEESFGYADFDWGLNGSRPHS